MRNLVWIFLILVGLPVFAESVNIHTPRGVEIRLDIYAKGHARALLLAPGQGCNPRLDLYETLADEAGRQGVTLIRMYWAYCLTTPNGEASADLALETEDFKAAIDYVSKSLGYSRESISLGGKSLGSLVSWPIFRDDSRFASLVLLTPVCTNTEISPSTNVFSDQYPKLSEEKRRVLLAQGNADPICETAHFQQFITATGINFTPLVIRGDHRFNIVSADGSVDQVASQKNLQALAQWLFIWLP